MPQALTPAAIAAATLVAWASISSADATAVSLPNAFCEVKAVSTCTPDGACKAVGEVLGAKVPARITIDYDNRVISEPHGQGWTQSAHIGTLARAAGQTIAHGIEGPFAWQVLVYDKDGSMSYVASTADVIVSAFGKCTDKP
jgi:hypothetical protein